MFTVSRTASPCQHLRFVPRVRRRTYQSLFHWQGMEIRVDDAALLRHGSGRWLLIRDVYYASPLPVSIQAPDRYSSEMNRRWRTTWAGHGQFVLAPHVGQFAVR